ncbi:MAG: hypothetical protein MI810_14935 [Flavobacteriales bacterium]|nr:hypothetical protein [Flavobacteriales bacterium]
MLTPKSILFIFSSFFLLQVGLAQDSLKSRPPLADNEGIIKFLVDVDNGYFEILVEDSLLIRRYKDTLPAGTYQAKVWSPGYVTQSFEFSVQGGKVTEKYIQMAYTNEKQQFERDYKAYRTEFHKSLTIPAAAALSTTLYTGFAMMKAYDTRKKLDVDVALYHQAATAKEVSGIKLNIDKLNKRYNFYRSSFYLGAGVSTLLWITTIYTYSKFKRNVAEPVFKADSPWRDKFSMQVSPLGCRMVLKLG